MPRDSWKAIAMVCVLSAASAAMGSTATTQPTTTSSTTTTSVFSSDATTLSSSSSGGNEFGGMSIEELLNVVVASPAGLTPTDERALPVDVTELDAKDIEQSGARNLDEVMNIFVPNAEIMSHNSPPDALGMAGSSATARINTFIK